jgi:uncharacterized protein YgiM (DUF1202 family)
MLNSWKQQNLSAPAIAVNLANACIGWSYVFGARGEKCTPANRRLYYNSKKKETIKTKCKNFDGTGSCSGCKWYPKGVTLFYDCRGFTYWVLLKAAGIKIMGAGATSQYNDDSNWEVKGPIEQMPKDRVCCVFRWDGSSMAHTLLYDGNGYYIHDSGEVKKTSMTKYNATHYAIPKGLYSDTPTPAPVPPEPTPDPGTAIVTGKNVALREGPSTSTKVQIRIPTGTTVKLNTLPSDWAYVSYGSRTGFMMKAYLNETDGGYIVTGKNVALRAGPSTSTTVLSRIATGKTVKNATLSSDWEYLSYGTREGFMMKQYLKE